MWGGVEDAGGIDQSRVGVQLKTEAGKIERLDIEIALGGNGFVGKAKAYQYKLYRIAS